MSNNETIKPEDILYERIPDTHDYRCTIEHELGQVICFCTHDPANGLDAVRVIFADRSKDRIVEMEQLTYVEPGELRAVTVSLSNRVIQRYRYRKGLIDAGCH